MSSIVKNVKADLTDIKVTKNGVAITLKGVQLKGEDLSDLSQYIDQQVLVTVGVPQMDIFDADDEIYVDAPPQEDEVETDVIKELDLN